MSATVNELAADREAREVWAALPIREAFPIGSKWRHNSYGMQVFEIAGYSPDGNHLLVKGDDGITNEWVRAALDSFGTLLDENGNPVNGSLPYIPAVGDRVRVTRDDDWPANQGQTGTVREVNSANSVRVQYDAGQGQASHSSNSTSYGWWVQSVERLPETSQEASQEAASTEAAPVVVSAPYVPRMGDLVRVSELSNPRYGAPATLLNSVVEYRQIDPHDIDRVHLVRVNGGDHWVKAVAPAMPATVEELRALLEAAEAKGKAEAVPDREIRAAKREARQEAVTEFEAWKSHANEVAIQYANDNSLCSEFDRCMIAIGLEPRDTFEREWEVTFSYTVTARDEDAAVEAAQDAWANGYVDADVEEA